MMVYLEMHPIKVKSQMILLATCEVIRYKNIAYVREKRKRSNGSYDAMASNYNRW